VQLVISEAHAGVQAAVAAVRPGAAGQQRREPFARTALARALKAIAPTGAATIRRVFVQPDAPRAREQGRRVADGLRPRFPRVAALMEAAEADVLADLACPAEHGRQLHARRLRELAEQRGISLEEAHRVADEEFDRARDWWQTFEASPDRRQAVVARVTKRGQRAIR
jgi:transposase-like protein